MKRNLSILFSLIFMIAVVVPGYAQEPDANNAKIFLPVVSAGSQTADAAQEEDLTDNVAEVEAADSSNRGMVFVTTNAVDPVRGNEIVMYRRDGNGLLTVTGRFPTGGQGLGAGLGSQGALILSENGQWLFVVNAGSNEISVFSVESAGLVLTDKIASGGIRPTSLSVRKNRVFVLNAGDPGNITGFKLNKEGRLAPLPNSTRPLSNNGNGAAPAPAQVSFSPDGDHLVVSERASNLLVMYNVKKDDNISAPLVFNSSGVTPFGFAFAREETLVVSEAFGGAVDGSAVSSYAIKKDQIKLISGSVLTGQTAACWIVVSKNGKYAYSTNAGSASVSGYRVGEDGKLTLINGRAGDTGAGTGPTDPAISRDGRWIYVLSPRSQTVVGFATQSDGSLQAIGSFGGLQAGAAGIAAW